MKFLNRIFSLFSPKKETTEDAILDHIVRIAANSMRKGVRPVVVNDEIVKTYEEIVGFDGDEDRKRAFSLASQALVDWVSQNLTLSNEQLVKIVRSM